MKLSRRQLKRIIREEKQKLQELDFSGPAVGTDADVYGSNQSTDCLAMLLEAVRSCYNEGMSMDDVLDAAEQAYLNSAL